MRWRDAFREMPPPGSPGPPRVVRLARWFGLVMVIFMIFVAVTGDPGPGLHGRGLGITAALLLLLAAAPGAIPRAYLPPFGRAWALVALAVASVALSGLQPGGAAVVGAYIVVVVAALRLRLTGALVVCTATVAAEVTVMAFTADKPGDQIFGLLTSIVPWLLVMRLVRNLREGRNEAEALVEELRESRSAEAEAAAVAERSRVARDMHDVLAHSLSALALQLEGARLLARDRDSDPEVVEALERAHHLAAGGLQEARRAIAALHGDELLGPEGLQALADAFTEHSQADCSVTVDGDPLELSSEARLAVYRTAQEALTNVRKHAAADRVELRLRYSPGGTTFEVTDHGRAAPVPAGALAADSGGYGLSGMRERAELLGGTLSARPTETGFRVQLWLPA